MATLQLQVKEAVFLEAVKAEMRFIVASYWNRIDDAVRAEGPDNVLERIECDGAAVVHSAPGLVRQPFPGELLVRLDLVLYLTSLQTLLASPHLSPPAVVKQKRQELHVALRVDLVNKSVVFEVLSGAIEGKGTFAGGWLDQFEMDGGRLAISAAAIVARDGVVAVLISNDPPESVSPQALRTQWHNLLGEHQWGYFIAGDYFAEAIANVLNDAADGLSRADTDPQLEVTQHAQPVWDSPRAFASVAVNAIDAIPLGFDAPVTFTVTNHLQAHAHENSAKVTLNVRIEWQSEDFLSDIGIDFVRADIDVAVRKGLSKLGLLEQFEEVGRGSGFVAYERRFYFPGPRARSVRAGVLAARIDAQGLSITGDLATTQPSHVEWSYAGPQWKWEGDCGTRRMDLVLKGPQLRVTGDDPMFGIRQTRSPKQAVDFWLLVEKRSDLGSGLVCMDLEFVPQQRLLVMSRAIPEFATSVVVFTNVGARRVEIQGIGERPQVSSNEALARTAHLISRCMAISSGWRQGTLNLERVVDPPDEPWRGRRLQDWLLIAKDIWEVSELQLEAVDPSGNRRPLPPARVLGGRLFARVVTRVDEALSLVAGRALHGHAPKVFHRWLQSRLEIDVGNEPVWVAARGNIVRALTRDGQARRWFVANVVEGALVSEEAFSEPADDDMSSVEVHPTPTSLRAPSLVVTHENRVVFAVAGGFVPYAGLASHGEPLQPLEQCERRPLATMIGEVDLNRAS